MYIKIHHMVKNNKAINYTICKHTMSLQIIKQLITNKINKFTHQRLRLTVD